MSKMPQLVTQIITIYTLQTLRRFLLGVINFVKNLIYPANADIEQVFIIYVLYEFINIEHLLRLNVRNWGTSYQSLNAH